MSLKDWMKKVEESSLNEGTQTIMLPTLKQGSTAPTGQQTAVAIDTSKPGANVLAAAFGAKPGSTTTIANQNSPAKAIAADANTANSSSTTTQTVGGTTQVSETELDQVHSFYDEIKMEAKPQARTGSSLDYIKENHPHECKMFEAGWGLDESLYGALVDHYFKEGRIPRGLILEGGQALREFVESCYAKDTGMGGNQAAINSGMLDEEDVTEGIGGDMAKLIGVPVVAGAAAIGAQYYDDQQPHVQVGGQNAKIVRADSNRIPDNAMILTGKDGKQYRVWQQSGKGMSKITFAAPVQGTNECVTEGPSFNDWADKMAAERLHLLNPAKQGEDDLIRAQATADNNAARQKREVTQNIKNNQSQYRDPSKMSSAEYAKYMANRRASNSPLEETSELERMLRQSTKENTMYESKKSKKAVEEAVEKTKTGIKHKADAGGYGRKDDEEDGKKVAKDEPKKGRGRPKKSDNASGEDKKFDFSALSKTSASKAPKTDKWDKKKTTTHKIATKADREEIDEGETIEKKGGRIHKGSYGTSHEAGDEGVKKVATQRGRGRPKKDADDSGEVKNYDWSAFGAKKGVKLPDWDKKKTTKVTKMKDGDKNDKEEVEEAKLKGKQSKLDINKNGKLDGADFAMLRGQKKKKDPQMESWDAQLKNLLTEGMTVSTSVGNEGGKDSVSITANDADAHKLLQILQNAGISGQSTPQVMSTTVQPAKSTGPATTATSPATTTTGGSAADDNIETAGGNVSSMPMPRGMAFSVQPAETEVPTAPEEIGVADSEEVISALGKEHGQSNKTDNGDDAMAFLKKAIGYGSGYATGDSESATTADAEEEVAETDEDGKKPDEDGDGVPDWADKEEGEDDSEEDDSEEADDSEEEEVEESEEESDDEADDSEEESEEETEEESDDEEEKVDEGKETCNECGGLMEDDHQCGGQLNEWSNSPQGQADDEQFLADIAFLTKSLAGGLNKPKVDQTVMPHTKVKIAESKVKSAESAYTLELKKLAGI